MERRTGVAGATRPGRMVLAALSTVVLALGLSAGLRAPRASAATVPHVMIVMMENKNFGDVIGQQDQPYTNFLADHYGVATRSYAFGHPSLPNYLTIVSGSNQGVTDDNPPSSHRFSGTPTLASQLEARGLSARAYAEDLPGNPASNSGEYAVRHFPWEYFPNAPIAVRNATSLTADLDSASPPDFVWYTPNLINDEHDGSVGQGDAFLRRFIPAVQATAWYRDSGQIIIEWDESDNDNSGINGGDGGHVATIVVSAALAAHPVSDASPVDTAGVLRSVEDRYGLAHLANAADAASGTIDTLLRSTVAPAPRRFISASHATAVAGRGFAFVVKASGTPTPKVTKHGRLPAGVHFHKKANGTAWLTGTPSRAKAPGTYHVTFEAHYGKGHTKQVMRQAFTLTVAR